MILRTRMIDSINRTVDEMQNLGAENIADDMLNNFLSEYIDNLKSQVDNAHAVIEALRESGQLQADTELIVRKYFDL